MQHAILAILSGNEQSSRVVGALRQAGFTADDISVLLPDEFGAQELGFERTCKGATGATFGMCLGLVLGAIFGYVAWEMRLPISGLETLFMGGALPASLSMAALFAIGLGALGGFIGSTIPEYIAKKYDRKTRYGGSLISVHVDNTTELRVAEEVLKTEGAQEIKITSEDPSRKKPVQLTAQ